MDTFRRVCFITLLPLISCVRPIEGSMMEEQEALELREGPLPKFLPTPTYYTGRVGQKVVLKCAVTDLGEKQIIWRKTSATHVLSVGLETFLDDDRIIVERDEKEHQWNLVFEKAQLADTGLYECQVSSQQRHLRKHVHLTIKEEMLSTPRPDINISGSRFAATDDTIYLVCNATGLEHPPDDIDWFFEGTKLSTNHRVIIKEYVSLTARTIVSSLEIRDATLNDSGMYICRTSNLQIQNLRVSVLKTDSNNVKRGTIPGQSDQKYDGHLTGDTSGTHQGGAGSGGKGSANYHKNDDEPGSGGHRMCVVNAILKWLPLAIVLGFYKPFPS